MFTKTDLSLKTLLVLLSLMATSAFSQAPRYVGSDATKGASRAVIVPDAALVHTGQVQGRTMHEALDALARELAAAGSSLSQCVKLNVYATQAAQQRGAQQAIAEKLPAEALPAVTFVATRLPDPNASVAVDAVALAGQAAPIPQVSFPSPTTSLLPAGGVAYVSGQAVKGDDLSQSTVKTMEELGRTLEFLGATWRDVVQAKAFLQPMSAHEIAQREIERVFSSGTVPPIVPPIVMVEWNVGTGAPIEIELIVGLPAGKAALAVEYLTPPGMKASPIYSHVARFAGSSRIYTSGFSVEADAAGQVHGVFQQLQKVLDESGSDLKHLIKGTYYVAADDVSKALNEIRPLYYDAARPPAASKAMVAPISMGNSTMTLDWIAVPR
jgi:enamine deaminase RidA (YjgF/YER057c/UK114 family)